MSSGYFLAIEGIEGSGKTTQVARLEQAIRATGRNTIVTKEPGGTPLGNRIRAILLDPHEEGIDAMSELFLYAASRRQHVVELIRPSLERGAVVICDRFTDATLAYQGFGRMLDLDRLRQINEWATDGIRPNLTVILDIGESIGLDRARTRNAEKNLQSESRLEGEDVRFHRRVREGYLALAESEPDRYAVVDAGGSLDEVFDRLLVTLRERAAALRLPAPESA
ncbi:MAG: dTMP kinase [Thermoanaerobaculia bacterium]